MRRRGGALNMSEMQRVALARALVTEPKLLLLDEPMSNLDAALRASLRGELKLIQKALVQSVLYVTHDQVEAMSMSDRIAVMREGSLEQIATPDEIYNRPATRFVAEFIGDPPINLLECTIRRSGARAAPTSALQEGLDLGVIDVPSGTHTIGIRPHDLTVARQRQDGHARTTVRFLENLGAEHVLHLDYGGGLLAAVAAPGFAAPGENVWIHADARHLHLIRNDNDQVIRAESR
jgi:ABC-type sugar transport system ATPase subunit